jgi:nucleotide-binding universal stress UspA family protein
MSTAIRTMVAGVATVQEADPILAPAIALAEATGATLHLVHAYELPDPLLSAYARDGVLGPDFGANYREHFRTELLERVRAISDSPNIRCHAVAGPASEVVCETAEKYDADLLLVGATRAGKFLRSILGSTAERVVRAATVPVLVLRQPTAVPVQRVLLTTDLSEFSADVHERGLDLVEALYDREHLELRSLLVVWYDLAFPPPLRRDSLEIVAEAELDAFLVGRNPRELSVEPRVRIGDPAKEITTEAMEWPADLLVLGTHSRMKRSRFLLGSVAEATVRATTTNVLILPPVPSGGGGAGAESAPAGMTASV